MNEGTTKKRLLLILDLLYRKSDENNTISTVDIMEYLNEKGFTIDRKTLATDIKILTDMNYDIVTVKSSPNKYFWGNRTFELPELKMLIDAVSSSRFITKKKSQELVEKISSLAGEHQQEQIKRHIISTSHVKSDNKKIYYVVDTITDAINQKKKIQFKYTEYNADKEKVFRHNGKKYTLSPYTLYWNEDYYYVVGYYDERECISAFRVDRLHNPKIIDERAITKPKAFDVKDYADKIFRMYHGEKTLVELECDNSVMKYIIDRYGIDVETNRKNENIFVARVPAMLSPTFYGWIFQFAGKIKIVSPELAINSFNELIAAHS